MTTLENLLESYSVIMPLVDNHSEEDRWLIKSYLDMLVAQIAIRDDSISPDKFDELLEFLDK